jgi:hypothetical protein
VKLTVDGRSMVQTLVIKKDPRIPTTDAEFGEQFDLLVKIRDTVSMAHRAANDIRDMLDAIAAVRARAEAADGRKIAEEARKLAASLEAIRGDIVEPRYTGIDDQLLVFSLKLNNRIAALQGTVASADRKPTDQAHAAFKELSGLLAAQLARLDEVVRKDVAAFNALVREQGLPAIVVKTRPVSE